MVLTQAGVVSRVVGLDDEMSALVEQSKRGFEKLHQRLDGFTSEVQQFVAQQTGVNNETVRVTPPVLGPYD